MAEDVRVLVDSSIWIDFLHGVPEAVHGLNGLLKSHEALISGQIKQEVLQGARDRKAFAQLEAKMTVWTYEPEVPADFVEAARIFAELRWKGITAPPSDCLIAAVARRCGVPVYSSDPDYTRIPGLKLFQP